MIRIGVFSGLYLVPLVTLLGCYVYEQVNRITWEITWVSDHCRQYHIPCPYQAKTETRPELALFMIKYLMTLIVGISAVFWVGSKKTCTEWAGFFKRNRKRDPISESRRVLQESCEFFLKHNSKVKHKKKHCKPSSHKLKVISKSMGTSTGATGNHGTSSVAITNHDYLGQEASTEIPTSPETSVREVRADGASTPRSREEDCGEPASPAASSSKLCGEHADRKGRAGNGNDKISVSESTRSEGRVTPKSDVTEAGPGQSYSLQAPGSSEPGSPRGSTSLLVHSASGGRKEQGPGSHSDT